MAIPPSPFFRLPRELRDKIYAEVGGDDVAFNTYPRFNPDEYKEYGLDDADEDELRRRISMPIQILSHPSTFPKLVSRQFADEYETEIRRHTVVQIHAMSTESEVPDQILEVGTHLTRCLKWVPALEMRLWNEWIGDCMDAEMYRDVRESFLPYMPNVKNITDYLLFPVDDLDSAMAATTSKRLNAVYDDARELRDKADEDSNDTKAIKLTPRVYLSARLVCMSRTYQATTADHEGFPLLHTHVPLGGIQLFGSRHPSNRIRYLALPDEEGCFDIQVDEDYEETVFEFEKIMTEYEAGLRARIAHR